MQKKVAKEIMKVAKIREENNFSTLYNEKEKDKLLNSFNE
jgi:hypothetical protein